MTDIALPSGLCPAKVTWTLDRNRAIEESPYSRVAQTQGRTGDRWRATVSWPVMQDDDAYALATWLDQVSKVGNHALVPVHQNDLRSNFSRLQAPPLSLGWRRAGEFAKWSIAANAVAAVTTNGLRIFNGSPPGAPLTRTFAVSPNFYYVVVLDIHDTNDAGWRLRLNDGVSDILDVSSPDNGRTLFTVLPASANLTAFIYASRSGVEFVQANFGDFQLYRVLRLSAANAGAKMLIARGDNNGGLGNDQLRAGQFITVKTSAGYQLMRLQADASSTGSITENGNQISFAGKVYVEPAPRGAIAANETVLHHQPWCRMRLADASSTADITPPLQHGFSVDFVEEL